MDSTLQLLIIPSAQQVSFLSSVAKFCTSNTTVSSEDLSFSD
jgi:hypothetical protein